MSEIARFPGKPRFNVGDVVAMRGGGEKFTVVEVEKKGAKVAFVHVKWTSADGLMQADAIPPAALQMILPHDSLDAIEAIGMDDAAND